MEDKDFYSFEELKDEMFGVVGTPKRDEYEKEFIRKTIKREVKRIKRFIESEINNKRLRAGSPRFMLSEQLRNGGFKVEKDLYSYYICIKTKCDKKTGYLLYRMLAKDRLIDCALDILGEKGLIVYHRNWEEDEDF